MPLTGFPEQTSVSTLVKRAPFGVFVIDTQFRIVMVNDGAQAAFVSVRPLIGHDFAAAIHIIWPEPTARDIVAKFRHTLDSGEPYFAPSLTERRHDIGRVEFYEWQIHRVVLPDGQFGIVCYFFDSTDLRRTEAALQRSDERLQMALAASRMVTWQLDPALGKLSLSANATDVLGVPPDMSIEQAAEGFAILHPDDVERHRGEIQRAVEECTSFNTQFRILRPDNGAVMWLEEWGHGVRDAAGEVQLVGVVMDITHRKQIENDLIHREEELRVLTDAVPALISYVGADQRYRFVNRQYELWFGRSRADVLGRHLREVLGDEAYERVRPNVERVLAGERFEFEMHAPYKNGGSRHIHIDYVPRFDGGRVVGYFGLVSDISERKRQENILRVSEDRLRFLDGLGQATRAATDAETVLHITTERLGRYLGALRCAYADLEPDNDRFTIRDDWSRPGSPSSRGVYSLDHFGRSAAGELRSGSTLVVRDVGRELADDSAATFQAIGIAAVVTCPLVKDGRLVALMAVHSDVVRDWTADEISLIQEVVERSWVHIERVRSALELKEADRRKDDFLATLAHELRNPLAPLCNGLEVLKQAGLTSEILEQTRDMMDRQLGQMVRLIDDLLDVNRIRRGKIDLRREPACLADVVRQAIETSGPLIKAGGHTLTLDLAVEPIIVNADVTRLVQVFANLLNNAAKFSDAGGAIGVSLVRDGADAVVRVTDRGVGIPTIMLARIFEMFIQVDRTLEKSQGGLGIGLSLVKGLIDLHDGTIVAASDGPGRGSEFVVRLPVAEQSAPAEVLAAQSARPGGRRILIVDDNHDAAVSLAMVLGLLGHLTRTAHDGLEGLTAAAEFGPDVVLLDLGMPRLNGYDACRRLRESHGRGVLLVALTGWGQAEDRRKTQEAGFDHHLVKPVDLAKLQSLLAEPMHSSI